jgi:Ni,Fe-hydrogenase III large subunit/Ni,Fe-hydrogenase III component G
MIDVAAAVARLKELLTPQGATGFTARGNVVRFEIGREGIREGARLLLARFEMDLYLLLASDRREDRGGFDLIYLFADPDMDWFAEMTAIVPPDDPRYPSLATLCYPASRYEREIRDLFGLHPSAHPDLRPLVRHGFWPEDYHPLRKDAAPPGAFADDGSPFPFQRVEGEGVYEIPVGPVHAGIIEPGHFRFSVDGETILEMKSRLYFTHKGTEKLFEGKRPEEALPLSERISGDTAVGHSLAFCQAVEALSGMTVPPRARFIRTVLLEMERLYNHVADFGMIASDTGFALAHSHAYRIREALFRLNKALAGHRLLRGVIVPGGVSRDLPGDVPLPQKLEKIGRDFEELVKICLANSMLRDRLRGAGKLERQTARDQGVLGVVARASGIDRDARRDHPFAAYPELRFKVTVEETGDVQARALVRVGEFRESMGLIRQALERMPGGALGAPGAVLPPRQNAFGLVEGWRGAILHWIQSDAAGRLHRVKVKDPSFSNWRALSYALRGNIVPDFPLCNKSFNLSYSGNDL